MIDSKLLDSLANNNPRLVELDLSRKYLNDFDIIKLVESLKTNTTLHTLDLDDNNIGTDCIKALATNKTLHTLKLYGNNIVADGSQVLGTNTILLTLYLVYNNIGADGA